MLTSAKRFFLVFSLLFLCFAVSSIGAAETAETKICSGDYPGAGEILRESLKSNPEDWAARMLLLELAELTGDKKTLNEQKNQLLSFFRQGKLKTAEAMTVLGESIRLESPKMALKCFEDAKKLDPKYSKAYLKAGFLYYEKYAWSKAGVELEKALELDPKDAETQCGLALLAARDGNIPQASAFAKKALELEPGMGLAGALNATFLLLGRENASCKEQLSSVLAVNPNEPHALAVLAAYYDSLGEVKERDEVIRKLRGINPRNSEVYLTLSEFAEERYRFEESLAWARKAQEADPSESAAYFQCGMALARLGEEREGYAQLEIAFKKNPYNVCAYNMLQVLDRDFKNNEYALKETEHFAVKLRRDEEAILWPYLESFLEDTYRRLTTRYKFEPVGPKEYKGKILLLVLGTHQDFSVRTIGLPSISAAGVCFGKVIAIPSPRFFENSPTGEFYWRAVVEHEFTHVISLQRTDYRIPRWFTEGLSCLEEKEFSYIRGKMLSSAMKHEMLLPVDRLEPGFIAGGNLMALHYYQAELICKYIEKEYGFEKLLQLLDEFKAGTPTDKALAKVMGGKLELSAIDGEFKGCYEKANNNFAEFLKSTGLQEEEKAEEEKNEPEAGQGDKPKKFKRPVPLWKKKVEALLEAKKTGEALAFLENYSKYDNSTFEVFKLLGLLHAGEGNASAALRDYESAFYINPYDAETHLLAARLYKAAGEPAKATREYRVLLALDADNAEASEYLKGQGGK